LRRGAVGRDEPLRLSLYIDAVKQAAVEFVCQPDSLRELLRQLNVSNSTDLKPFEAVLRVQVRHDVPFEAKLIAVRKELS
jgi:hypothetical protein